MKITYFVRDPREGNFSLEAIFKNVGEILRHDHQVDYFYVNANRSKFWNLREARRNQGDINHITGDVNWLAFGLNKKKTILTAHDLGHYENTLKGIKKAVYGKIWWQWPIYKVTLLTAISEFTRNQLIKHFHVPDYKIQVVHNPVGKKFQPVFKSFNKTKPAILQVGSMKNKNVENLIRAIKDIPCKLHLLRKMNKDLKNFMEELKIEHEFHFDISEEEVIALYGDIDILYFASTYEGFGLPIIEAQAIGRAIITSNIPPMPEVAGAGAHFVNPYSVKDIRKGIIKLIEETNYRNNLINFGFDNIKRFEIEKIAGQYLSLYNNLLNH